MNDQNDIRHPRLQETAASPSIDRARQIDRLVCGDLGHQERLELLTWLDAEPQRWRRCAQSFLEAQVWRETFAVIENCDTSHHPTVIVDPPLPKSAEGRSWRISRQAWRPAISMAAVALIFGCGWLSGNLMHQRLPEEVAAQGLAQQTTDELANQKQSSDTSQPHLQAKSPNKVVVAPRPPNCEFTLPMLGPGLPEGHWARQSSVPGYVKSRWGNQGYQVSENRRFVPMQLADGRKVVVPINHVTLTFVGQHTL